MAMQLVQRAVRQTLGIESPADLKARIARLRADGVSAHNEAERLDAQALVCETDEEAQALKQQAANARLRADRLAQKLPTLELQLSEARRSEKDAAWRLQRDRFQASFEKFFVALTSIEEQAAHLIEIGLRTDDREIQNILTVPSFLRAWLAERRAGLIAFRQVKTARGVSPSLRPKSAAIRVPPSSRSPAPEASKAKATSQPESTQHQIEVIGGIPHPLQDPNKLTAKRAPDDLSALEPGQVRARVLRSGFSPADTAPQCARGQLVVMRTEVAEKSAAAGVIEIVEHLPPGECNLPGERP